MLEESVIEIDVRRPALRPRQRWIDGTWRAGGIGHREAVLDRDAARMRRRRRHRWIGDVTRYVDVEIADDGGAIGLSVARRDDRVNRAAKAEGAEPYQRDGRQSPLLGHGSSPWSPVYRRPALTLK